MGIPERKEREFRRREDEILEAALRLFDSDEWQGVTIERIAQEAEIGKGTVYLHFPTKEDIYARLALDFLQRMLGRMQAIDAGLPVLERLRAAIRVFFDAHREGREYRRVLEYCHRQDFCGHTSEATCREFAAFDEQMIALIHGIIQQGIDEGIFPRKPIPVLLYGAQSALFGARRTLWSAACCEVTDADAYVEEITRFILAGLIYQDRVPASAGA